MLTLPSRQFRRSSVGRTNESSANRQAPLIVSFLKRIISSITVILMIGCTFLGANNPPSGYQSSPYFGKASHQRDQEVLSLPARFYTESLVTEGAVLRNDILFDMLSKRGLRFIEVKIRRITTKENENKGYVSMIYLDQEKPITVSAQGIAAAYARIELADSRSPNCIKTEDLPESLTYRINNPPILPDTCLAVTFIEKPQAKMALAYDNKHPWGHPYGYWSLIDRDTNKTLFSLTSADSATQPSNGNSGHRDLALRIWNWLGYSSEGYRAVKQSIVVADPPFSDVIANKENLPLIQMTRSNISSTTKEWESQTNEVHARWQGAVNKAAHSGWSDFAAEGAGYYFTDNYRIRAGAHGKGRILDWARKDLIGIQLVETGASIPGSIKWEVSASERGFLAFTNQWEKASRQVVARYNLNGKLEWAFQIHGEAVVGCGFGPGHARETKTDIFLLQPNCPGKQGKEWRIPKVNIRPEYPFPSPRTSLDGQNGVNF